jgi:hypothetical protein
MFVFDAAVADGRGGNRLRTIRRAAGLVALAVLAASCSSPKPRPTLARKPVTPIPRYVPWGEHTVETRLAQVGAKARARWKPLFEAAAVSYPPRAVVLVGLKRERRVEVYAGPSSDRLAFVRDYAVTAASGGPGPKLREGDKQVPEGIYAVEALNPNSRFHLSLRLDYPNEFDRRIAENEGRNELGGDIMIHGGAKSIGCIAVGDEGAEDLFVLAADAGAENLRVVLAPRDFRRTGEADPLPGQPVWVRILYSRLDDTLRSLPTKDVTTASRTTDGGRY